MVLHLPEGTMPSACSHSSYPSNAVCLGLCGAGGVSALLPVLGFSQGCLVHNSFSGKGEQSQDYACCHLGDITPFLLLLE